MIIKHNTKYSIGDTVYYLQPNRAFGDVEVKENTISTIEFYTDREKTVWLYRLDGDACAYLERRLFKTPKEANDVAHKMNKYLTNKD